jgi:hypothetical protein
VATPCHAYDSRTRFHYLTCCWLLLLLRLLLLRLLLLLLLPDG